MHGGQGCAPMWGVVTQLPVRALGLEVRVWGLCLHLLSLGLRAFLLFFLVLLRELCVCVQEAGRAVLMAARSVALTAHVCSVYVFLQGVAWSAQLVGSWVMLHIWLYRALLETPRRVPLLPQCEQAARWLVWASMQAGKGLARVWGVATFVQLCAHTVFLSMYLCMHICFAAISSKVRVRVNAPFCVSVPLKVHAPLSLGIKVGLQGQKHGRATGEAGMPQGEMLGKQEPQTSRSPKPTRRREVSRSELSPVIPSAATLIIVVCVGFLVLMVVLGLVRIHSLHRRVSGAGGPPGASSDPKDPDLFWDDSALTIIVNPMESYQNRQSCVTGAVGGQQEDEDSSDSEVADSPSSDERRIIETPPHRY
ncbi:calsyntenin 3 [Homo sapiens]|uniref:Isoform CLSTN3beta of Calsyntenin-3 n=1 Tax=Homo sapiens TaxID=9606 RepID=Q9BQT9-3|nr:calsyntenin 3 [Homo sapiens]KAI4064449.1 calsyntenin 3 [Homo sapiens]